MNNKAVITINKVAIAMKFETSLAASERSMSLRWALSINGVI